MRTPHWRRYEFLHLNTRVISHPSVPKTWICWFSHTGDISILNWIDHCSLQQQFPSHSVCYFGLLFFGVSFALFPKYIRFCTFRITASFATACRRGSLVPVCFIVADLQGWILPHRVVKTKWVLYVKGLEQRVFYTKGSINLSCYHHRHHRY